MTITSFSSNIYHFFLLPTCPGQVQGLLVGKPFSTFSSPRHRSSGIDVFHVFHDLVHLPLFGLFPSWLSRSALLATDSSLRITWPYHRRRASRIFYVIIATLMIFLTSSFITWSSQVNVNCPF